MKDIIGKFAEFVLMCWIAINVAIVIVIPFLLLAAWVVSLG